MFQTSKSILQQLEDPKGLLRGVKISVKRDDLIDDIVSGNKWRKLKYSLLEAERRKNEQILTFGGAFSNHLVATAKAGASIGMPTIGLVRGEELNENSNSTLKTCVNYGMKLHFLPRSEYTLRNDKMYLEDLHQTYENTFIVPEGGANYWGVIGCQEIWKELPQDVFTHFFLAAGTGTTASGILAGLPENTKLTVISALKGDFMADAIRERLMYSFFDEEWVAERLEKMTTIDDTHFGGYGKMNDELLDFIKWVRVEFNLPLDCVYTGKAFFQLIKQVNDGVLTENDHVLFLHTGGLQGNAEFYTT